MIFGGFGFSSKIRMSGRLGVLFGWWWAVGYRTNTSPRACLGACLELGLEGHAASERGPGIEESSLYPMYE
jgi:hypothetical protein